jgi:integrase
MKAKIRDLPAGVGIGKAVNGRGREYWRVRLGKRFTGGQVILKDFSKLSEAREWIFGEAQQEKASPGAVLELKQSSGAAAFSITPAQISEAAACFRRLEGLASLNTAVSYFLKHANPAGGKRTLAEVAKEFLKSREAMGVRSRTLTQYESYLRTIDERFGPLAIHEVRRAEIEDWLSESEWSKRTRNNYISTLSTLFLFARGRDYCAENPAEKVPRAILDDTPPGILTLKETAALLEIAREKDPEMLAYVGIGLFAGLRRSELCALEWSEIDRKARTIEVKGVKAKTRQRRIVSISDVLSAWLAAAPNTPRPTPSRNEDVCGERLKNLYSEERDESGAVLREAIVYPWPHNALRHSFGSYHYAKHRDENQTAAEMGNSPAMVFRHYRAVVTPDIATKFWNLLPSTAANVVRFAA